MRNTMKILPFLIALFSGFALSAQIEIIEPAPVQVLVNAWEQANFANPYVKGWRVQIGASNDLRKAEELKANFAAAYPDITVDWVQDYPYYKVRAGAFLEKREAKALIARLSSQYPGAYAAKDSAIPVSDF